MKKDQQLTIVKVMTNDGHPTDHDLERWRAIFAAQTMTEQQAIETGEVEIEHIASSDSDHNIILVKIGDEDYKPTIEDLQTWRDVFEEAKNDPDFKIFTHQAVEINVINLGKIVAIE